MIDEFWFGGILKSGAFTALDFHHRCRLGRVGMTTGEQVTSGAFGVVIAVPQIPERLGIITTHPRTNTGIPGSSLWKRCNPLSP